MKDDKGQILLLTGVILILLTFTIATMSTDLSNVEVMRVNTKSHLLLSEFNMVKQNFKVALDYNCMDLSSFSEAFNKTTGEFEQIEVKYNIDFHAEVNRTELPVKIILRLQNDDTMISQKFDYS